MEDHKIYFKLFKQSFPKAYRTRRDWSLIKKRGMLGHPKLPTSLKTIIKIFDYVKSIDVFFDPQLRYTSDEQWVVDVRIPDIVMNISSGGTHNLRGMIFTIDHRSNVYLRRTIYTRNEIAMDYVHSHVSPMKMLVRQQDRRIDYGVNITNSDETCLGTYYDTVRSLKYNITDSPSKAVFLQLINTLIQFLSTENRESPLNSATKMQETFSQISSIKLTDDDIKYVIDNGIVTFTKVFSHQNNVTVTQYIDFEAIPDDLKERYRAYLYDDVYYDQVTIPDTNQDFSHLDERVIPYGEHLIPITIIDNDHNNTTTKVFNRRVFQNSSAELFEYAARQLDTSTVRPEAVHQQ